MYDTAMNHAKVFKNFYADPLFGDSNGAKIVDLGAYHWLTQTCFLMDLNT